jgi:hypothetical protein
MAALNSIAATCEPPRWAGACGLLSDNVTSEDVSKFIRITCHEDPAAEPSQGCIEEFRDSFTDRLRKRYWLAREVDVRFTCKKTSRCKTLGGFEIEWLNSHNLHVQHTFEEEAAAVNAAAERKLEILERVRAELERQKVLAMDRLATAASNIATNTQQIANDMMALKNCYIWGC